MQKKCFIASAGFHGLLALVLLVGPGFLSAPAKPEDVPLLDFIPVKTVDDLISGGGNPKANPAAALPLPVQAQPQPQPPATKPPPVRQPDPEPAPEPATPKQPVSDFKEDDGIDPVKPKPRKVEISKTLITRKADTSAAEKRAKELAQAREEAKAAADARRRLARQIGQVAENIGNSLSGGTSIELRGPGGGGVPYANWKSAIRTIYERAWILPDGVVDNGAKTVASVTIARDGTVLEHSISRPSGDPVVDRSVESALERVRVASPLPDSAKESKRTITIEFSVRAKREIG